MDKEQGSLETVLHIDIDKQDVANITKQLSAIAQDSTIKNGFEQLGNTMQDSLKASIIGFSAIEQKVDKVADSILALNKTLSKTDDAIGDSGIAESAEKATKEIDKLQKETDDLTSANEKLKTKLSELNSAQKKTTETQAETNNVFASWTDTINESVGGTSKFGQSIVNLAKNSQNSQGFFSGLTSSVSAFGKTLLGLMANPAFLALAGVAGVAAGFKWWWDYNRGIEEATRLTQQFTGQQGEELRQTRASVQAIADSFGQEFDEVLKATNSLAKQMNISFDEALSTVKTGFIAGANANGEFLETIKEYPAYFKEAGLNAAQFVAITSKGVKEGVFSDKAVDTIKEANLRIREMPKATADAINGIGLDSAKIQRELTKGSKTTFQVMQEIAKKMKQLPPAASKVGTAIADIFGGPGEDAGLQFITSLAEIKTDLSEVAGEAGELGKLQNDLVDSNVELEKKISEAFDSTGGFFEKISTNVKILINEWLIKLLDYFIEFRDYLIDLWNSSEDLRKTVGFLATLWVNSFSTALKGAKALGVTLWNVAKLANPANWFNTSEMKKSISNIADAFSDWGKTFVNGWVDAFENGTEKFNKKIEKDEKKNENEQKKNKGGDDDKKNKGGGGNSNSGVEEIEKKRLKMQQDLRQLEINNMKEGLKKKIAQINFNKEKELKAIDDEYTEFEDKVKKAGKKISQADKENFARRKNEVEISANKEIVEAEKDNAKSIEELQSSLLSSFMKNEIAKQNAIKETYKKQREELEKSLQGGNIDDYQFLDMLNLINASEQKELVENMTELYRDYAEKIIAIEEWKQEEIKTINEEQGLTKKERSDKAEKVTKIANLQTEQAILDYEIPAEYAEQVQTLLAQVLNLSLEELSVKLKEAKEKLADAKLQVNTNPEQVKQLTTEVAVLSSALDTNIAKTKKSGKTAEEVMQDWADFAEQMENCIDSIKEMSSALKDVLGDATAEAVNDVMNIAELSISMIGNIKQFTTTAIEGTKVAAETGSEAVKTVERASVILAIISAAVQVAMKIANLFGNKRNEKANKKIEQAQNQIDALNDSYKKLDKNIENAYGNSAVRMIEEQDTLLRQQKQLIRQQIEAEKSKKAKNRDDSQIKEWENQIKEIDETLAGRKETITEKLIGKDYKSVLEDFSSEIMSAMDDADTSVEQATKNIAKSIKKAAVQTRLNEILQKDANKYADTLADAMKDGFLSDWEKQNLANIEQTISETSETYLKQFDDLWEQAEEERNGVSGGVTNMTQDTAEEMNGRLTQIQSHTFSISENVKRMSEFASRQLVTLQGIKNDTNTLVETTLSMKSTLDDITIKGLKMK